MSLGDDMQEALDFIRQIPHDLDYRQFTVVQVRVEYADAQDVFDGKTSGATTTHTTIVNYNGANPKVKWLTHTDYLRGAPQDAQLEVSQITPDYNGGGHSYTDLIPNPNEGGELYYLITGPGMEDGVRYEVAGFFGERKNSFKIYLKRASNNT